VRKEILAFFVLALILVSMVATIHMVALPIVVLASPNSNRREVWKIVEVANTHENITTGGDVKVTVSSSYGVDVSWSTNITEYFRNIAYWNGTLGYRTYVEWLNGTSTLPYHWGDMDWYVSEGSLTSITWDEIKYWWDMYSDTGGGVSYETFMGNTYMADCNLTDPGNDPDIVGVASWNGSNITIKDLVVPANMTVHIVFKIVITEPGAYAFDLTSPNPLLEISPSSWRSGGVKTILVPDEYSTIQAAIVAAVAGDTVLVGPGTYNERLVIDKQLNLTGSGTATIIRPTDIPAAGVYDVEIDVSGTIIQNFLFDFNDVGDTRGGQGIVVGDMNEPPVTTVQVLDNIIYTGDGSGVGGTGIQTGKNCDVSGLLIQGNTFYGDATGMGEGVYINPYEGAGGVAIYANEFYGYLFSGVSIEASNVTASNNVINSNATKGYYGVRFIDLSGGQTHNGVTISNNIIWNLQYGIRIGTSTDLGSNLAATVQYNNITCNDVGIWVRYGAYLTDSVHYNNIVDNTNYGIDNAGGERSVDAAYNWWGNETGPQHNVFNPLGTGDNVSDDVDFKPWLIQPYPPAVQVSKIYIDPNSTQYWTPAFGSTFTVYVRTNVTLLAGFQFNLTWDGTLLNLTNATYSPPWRPYMEVHQSNTTNSYALALSGYNTSKPFPFNGSIAIATLTFKAIYDSIFPENKTCNLALEDVILAGPEENQTIPCVIYNGTYSCNSTKPEMALMPQETVVKHVPSQLDLEVNVTNVVNLHAFKFNLTYNPTLIGALTVKVEPFFNGSYFVAEQRVDNEIGFVFVRVNSISPPANGSGALARITFKVETSVIWPDPPLTCNLAFSDSELLRAGDIEIDHDVADGTYRYEPIKGDLNMDGIVELYDLVRTAQAFGSRPGDPGWDPVADLIQDNKINILDIIVVARNFGRTS